MLPRLKLKNCLSIILGSAILAFGLYNIHSISGVTEGGVLGLTLLLEHWFGISPSISGLVLNGACYALGLTLLGREFIFYSFIAGGGFSLFYAIFERFPPLWPQIAQMPLTYIPFSKIIYSLLTVVLSGQLIGLIQKAGKPKKPKTT